MRLVILLAVLSFVTAVHSVGHTIGYLHYDVPVKVFEVGVGPRLGSTKIRSGLEVSFNLIPFGGDAVVEQEDLEAFVLGHPYQFMVVEALGPILNILVAMLCGIIAITTWPARVRRSGLGHRPFVWVLQHALVTGVLGGPRLLYRILTRGFGVIPEFLERAGILPSPPIAVSETGEDITNVVPSSNEPEAEHEPPSLLGLLEAIAVTLLIMNVSIGGAFAAVHMLPFFPFDTGVMVTVLVEHWLGDPAALVYILLSLIVSLTIFLAAWGVRIPWPFGKGRTLGRTDDPQKD